MGNDLRKLMTAAAPIPSRPLDMTAVAARARRLGYVRAAALSCVSVAAATAVTFAVVNEGLFTAEDARPVAPISPSAAPEGLVVFGGIATSGNGALYTIDPDSLTTHELFVHPESRHVGDPSWSGSAARIAFHVDLPGDDRSPTGQNSEIFVIDADGGDIDRVTDDEEPVVSPAWEPHGTMIAYGRADDARSWQLSLVRADGHAPHPLSDRPTAADYAWSPDGQKLAFSQFMYREDGQDLVSQAIFAMNVSNGNIERLTYGEGRASDPVWSPDGKQIAYLCDDGTGIDICMMEADGSASYEMYETIPGEDPIDPDAGLAWAPDGSRLLFATRGGGSTQPMTIDPLGRYDRPFGQPQTRIFGMDWR